MVGAIIGKIALVSGALGFITSFANFFESNKLEKEVQGINRDIDLLYNDTNEKALTFNEAADRTNQFSSLHS